MTSIIIPAHDEQAVVTRSIESLKSDTGADSYQLILVANGCSDSIAEVARRAWDRIDVVETEHAFWPELSQNEPKDYAHAFWELVRRPALSPALIVHLRVNLVTRLRATKMHRRRAHGVWERDDTSRRQTVRAAA